MPRRLLSVVAAVAALAIPGSAGGHSGGTDPFAFPPGWNGSYFTHRPPGLSRSRPTALVIVHGGRQTEVQTGFSEAADRYGFVAVYVTITRPKGDLVLGPGQPPYPDILYLADLIDRVVADENIDRSRVYMTGASGGGAESYRFACDFPEKVAAIGSISGIDPTRSFCNPRKPVSVMEIHGTADRDIPIVRAQESVNHWRTVNHCPATPQTAVVGRVTTQTWSRCQSGTGVALITLQGGDHGWYRGKEVDATEAFWQFFAAHPRAAGGLTASLVSVTVRPTKPRRIMVRLKVNEDAAVVATLLRGSHTVLTKRAILKQASPLLALTLPRTLHAGTYKLRLSLRGASGTQVLTRVVRIRR